MKEEKIYTFKELAEMGISLNTLRDRFYKYPEKYGVKSFEKVTYVKGIDEETFNAKWKHLIRK